MEVDNYSKFFIGHPNNANIYLYEIDKSQFTISSFVDKNYKFLKFLDLKKILIDAYSLHKTALKTGYIKQIIMRLIFSEISLITKINNENINFDDISSFIKSILLKIESDETKDNIEKFGIFLKLKYTFILNKITNNNNIQFDLKNYKKMPANFDNWLNDETVDCPLIYKFESNIISEHTIFLHKIIGFIAYDILIQSGYTLVTESLKLQFPWEDLICKFYEYLN